MTACRHEWMKWTKYDGHTYRKRGEFETCIHCQITRSSSPQLPAAPISQKGGENIMENIFITIDGVTYEYNLVGPADSAARAATPAPLTINRPFVVYDVNGDRVDGYKYESRALRNNKARFAGSGFWLGKADSADFVWIEA